jgi:phosphatidylglycerophosphate synthase
MNDTSKVSDALKVDTRVAGQGPLARFINKVITLKQWCRPLQAALEALPSWVTPNSITIFRGVLTIPVVCLILTHHNWVALAVALFSLSLDFVDGALAELRNQRTALGIILDPMVDKVTVTTTIFALMTCRPTTYAIMTMGMIIGLEIGIVIARAHRLSHLKPTGNDAISRVKYVAAKWPGKVKMICESLALPVLIIAPLYPNVLWTAGSLLLVPAVIFGCLSLASQLRD